MYAKDVRCRVVYNRGTWKQPKLLSVGRSTKRKERGTGKARRPHAPRQARSWGVAGSCALLFLGPTQRDEHAQCDLRRTRDVKSHPCARTQRPADKELPQAGDGARGTGVTPKGQHEGVFPVTNSCITRSWQGSHKSPCAKMVRNNTLG